MERGTVNLLMIVREPLRPGGKAAYIAIEDEIARACIELGCPHPHVALEPLDGPDEVWWINSFMSEADMTRVEQAYKENQLLMTALQRGSERKAEFTAPWITVVARLRPDLSCGPAWTLTGARYLAVATTQQEVSANASVFEGPDGTRYMLKPAPTREQAEIEAAAFGPDARVLAVQPRWGLPAAEWVDADPQLWRANPGVTRPGED